MIGLRFLFIILLYFRVSVLEAQNNSKSVQHSDMFWLACFNSLKVSETLSINSDIQGRTAGWCNQWSQLLARTGLFLKLKDNIVISVGFADFLSFGKNNVAVKNEYRPWAEGVFQKFYFKLKLMHRIRIEDRFCQKIENEVLLNEWNKNFRLRYKIDLQRVIKEFDKDRQLFFVSGNEIMWNAGKEIVNNIFDQNRTWFGIGWQLNKFISLQTHYMKVFQQSSDGRMIYNQNVLRINFYHSIS